MMDYGIKIWWEKWGKKKVDRLGKVYVKEIVGFGGIFFYWVIVFIL